ncbi:DUF7674 family protein [Methylobacterium brachiatum]
MARRDGSKPGVVAFAPHDGGPRYEEVADLVRREFPEWWEQDLAWAADTPHSLCGILAGRIGRAMYDGDKTLARRAASFGMQLAGSGDERVDNLVHVSFFESFHQVHPDDRRLVAELLDERTARMLEVMTADVGSAYTIQGLDDRDLRPVGRISPMTSAPSKKSR